MGNSIIYTSINPSHKLAIDGTELYREDGQTVCNIADLDSEEVLEILDIKKEPFGEGPSEKTLI